MPSKFVTLLAGIIAFGLVLTLMIFVCLIYDNLEFKNKILSKITDNWQSSPITSIQKTTENKCPGTTTPLVTGKYPGMLRGCNCAHSTSEKLKETPVYENFCDETELKNKCLDIKEQDSRDINIWKNTLLCATRADSITYDKIRQEGYKTYCPEGKKKCGIIDTENNILCVDQASECPINYLEILPAGRQPSFNEDVKEIQLDDNYMLYYSNKNTNGNIIVQTIINGDVNVCAYPNEGLLGQNNYLLNKNKGSDTCKEKINNEVFDKRFRRLDTENMADLFTENNLNPLISLLPEYPMEQGKATSLNAINYLGIKPVCYDMNFSENLLTRSDLPKMNNLSYGLIFMAMFELTLVFCGFCVYRIYNYDELVKVKAIVVDVIHIVLAVILLSLGIVIYKQLKDALSAYDYFQNKKCGDDLTLENLDVAYDHLKHSRKYAKCFVIISAVELGLCLAYCLFFYLTTK